MAFDPIQQTAEQQIAISRLLQSAKTKYVCICNRDRATLDLVVGLGEILDQI